MSTILARLQSAIRLSIRGSSEAEIAARLIERDGESEGNALRAARLAIRATHTADLMPRLILRGSVDNIVTETGELPLFDATPPIAPAGALPAGVVQYMGYMETGGRYRTWSVRSRGPLTPERLAQRVAKSVELADDVGRYERLMEYLIDEGVDVTIVVEAAMRGRAALTQLAEDAEEFQPAPQAEPPRPLSPQEVLASAWEAVRIQHPEATGSEQQQIVRGMLQTYWAGVRHGE